MKTWMDKAEAIKTYLAIDVSDKEKKIVGFIHFTEKQINESRVIYIAQAGVEKRGMGIGRRLMQCVLAHYPADTVFKVLTKSFNSDAITLYSNKFNFSPINKEDVRQLGLDERYCGFEHTTTDAELAGISALIK